MSKRSSSVKIFRAWLNLLQIDGPINEMLFWPKLLFVMDNSVAICDLVLCIFLEGNLISLDRQ